MSSHWEHKLYNYQQAPPASAWDAIAAGLDEQTTSFPEKLYNYEATPPAAAWQKIEAQLPVAETGGKVVAMPAGRKIVRYAAAAVILLALVGIAYFAAPDHNSAVATTNSSQANPATQVPTVKRDSKHFNVPPQAATMQDDATANNTTYAAYENMDKRVRQKRARVNPPATPLFASAIAVAPTEKNMVDAERTDRYMIATTDDGNPVRLPKKVYSAFACPDDEPSRQACELQLTLLQQKMSTSLTNDFAQFLDLLKNLQEN
jgi:hypothetical protein